jgi:hypothetical protein
MAYEGVSQHTVFIDGVEEPFDAQLSQLIISSDKATTQITLSQILNLHDGLINKKLPVFKEIFVKRLHKDLSIQVLHYIENVVLPKKVSCWLSSENPVIHTLISDILKSLETYIQLFDDEYKSKIFDCLMVYMYALQKIHPNVTDKEADTIITRQFEIDRFSVYNKALSFLFNYFIGHLTTAGFRRRLNQPVPTE